MDNISTWKPFIFWICLRLGKHSACAGQRKVLFISLQCFCEHNFSGVQPTNWTDQPCIHTFNISRTILLHTNRVYTRQTGRLDHENNTCFHHRARLHTVCCFHPRNLVLAADSFPADKHRRYRNSYFESSARGTVRSVEGIVLPDQPGGSQLVAHRPDGVEQALLFRRRAENHGVLLLVLHFSVAFEDVGANPENFRAPELARWLPVRI